MQFQKSYFDLFSSGKTKPEWNAKWRRRVHGNLAPKTKKHALWKRRRRRRRRRKRRRRRSRWPEDTEEEEEEDGPLNDLTSHRQGT